MAKQKQKAATTPLTPFSLWHVHAAQPKHMRLYAALLAALALLIYALRLDRVAGLYVDDAWYVLLGKALATGAGYQLINSPTPGIMLFYPPGYPFLLSLVFRLAEEFWARLQNMKPIAHIGYSIFIYRMP